MDPLLLAVLICLYFVPAFIAYRRNHRQRMAIMILDIFGGWSGLGWLVALVWACTADVETKAS